MTDRTLVATPDPEPQPQRPELLWSISNCVYQLVEQRTTTTWTTMQVNWTPRSDNL